jgi:hypothetical protein
MKKSQGEVLENLLPLQSPTAASPSAAPR